MSSFTGALIVQHDLDGMFTAWKPFRFQIIFGSDDFTVDVAEGARSNLSSVPPLVQPFIPKVGKYDQAGFIHDMLYMRHAVNCGDHWVQIDRRYADLCFFHAMQALDVAPWRATSMYYAVRVAGQSYWDRTLFPVTEDQCTKRQLPTLTTPWEQQQLALSKKIARQVKRR